MRLLRRRGPDNGPDSQAAAPRPRRRARPVVLGMVAGTAAVVAVAATYVVLAQDDDAPEQAAPIHVTGSTFIDLDPDLLAPTPKRQQPTPEPVSVIEPGSPRRLVIPSLGVDSEVVPITAPDGTLSPPDDGQQVGWWSDGAEPGARTGSALVTGHTFSRGGAALQELGMLERGDQMSVRTVNGTIDYRVSEVDVFSKGTVAVEAGELFSQSVPGRLVVITCDDYDGTSFLSNVVVTAAPIGRRPVDF